MELKRVKVVNIVTCCRCLCIWEVSTRVEQYNIIWPDTVILKENVGQNRPIGLQTCFKNSSKFHAKMHTLARCSLYRRNKVMPESPDRPSDLLQKQLQISREECTHLHFVVCTAETKWCLKITFNLFRQILRLDRITRIKRSKKSLRIDAIYPF